jgi:hypothetical protein
VSQQERCKDIGWGVSKSATGSYSYDAASLAVLMDLRDELKAIRAILECHNTQAIPRILRRISANTAKPRKAKKS